LRHHLGPEIGRDGGDVDEITSLIPEVIGSYVGDVLTHFLGPTLRILTDVGKAPVPKGFMSRNEVLHAGSPVFLG